MNPTLSRRQLASFMVGRLLAEPGKRRQYVRELAAFLVEHNRTNELELLLNDMASELAARDGQLSVEVESAEQLSPKVRGDIERFMKQQTGASKVDVHQSVQPELVGGFIVRTADAELNASVRHNLQKLAALS